MSKNKGLRLIDKPLYGYWQALMMSFYSPRLYVDVSKRWRGFGALYLLFIVAVLSIPLSIRFVSYMTEYINTDLLAPLEKIPPLYVQGGKVSIDEPMPYIIKNDRNKVVAIIDAKANVNQLSDKYPDLTIIITEDTIYFRQPKSQRFLGSNVQSHDEKFTEHKLQPQDTEVFSAKKWIKDSGVLSVRLITQFVTYPVVIIFFYSLYLALLVTLPLLGQLVAQVFLDFKLKYKESCRVFAVAATPQALVFFIFMAFDMTFPGLGFIYVALLAVYFFFALIFIKKEKKRVVHT